MSGSSGTGAAGGYGRETSASCSWICCVRRELGPQRLEHLAGRRAVVHGQQRPGPQHPARIRERASACGTVRAPRRFSAGLRVAAIHQRGFDPGRAAPRDGRGNARRRGPMSAGGIERTPPSAVLRRLVIRAGDERPVHVLRIARSDADAAAIAVDQLAAEIGGAVEHADGHQADGGRGDRGVARLRMLTAGQRRRHRFDRQQQQEDVAGPFAPGLVGHHRGAARPAPAPPGRGRRCRSGRPPGWPRCRARPGRWPPGSSHAAPPGQRGPPQRHPDQDQRDDEVHDLGMEARRDSASGPPAAQDTQAQRKRPDAPRHRAFF